MRTCTIDGCDRKHYGHGLCNAHYKRLRKFGDPNVTTWRQRPKGLTVEEAVAFHSEQGGECIVWTGSVTSEGYAQMSWRGKPSLVHRVLFESVFGPIQAGSQIDHKCRNRRCVKIDHLRLATPSQNQENQGLQANNTSGFRGVHRHRGAWVASVKHHGVSRHLGSFATAAEAGDAARRARLDLMTHNEDDRAKATA